MRLTTSATPITPDYHGYVIASHKASALAETWVLGFRTQRGSIVAAGHVTYHKQAQHWDVRYDLGEPCKVGSRGYNERRAAVRAFTEALAARG